MTFPDKVALVTGGASGIGKAVCLAFAAEGARVGVADVNGAGAEEVATAVTAAGGDGLPVVMDVTHRASVAAGVEKVLAVWSRIDILANVAGWDRIFPFVETTEEFWDKVIAINFRGILATTHVVLPHMIERRSGVIVNVSSEAGRAGSSGEAVYSGTKGAVIAFSKALAIDEAAYGVRVNSVSPGNIYTPLWQEAIDASDEPQKTRADGEAAQLPGRMGTVEEAGKLCLFIAAEATFTTGVDHILSGGAELGYGRKARQGSETIG